MPTARRALGSSCCSGRRAHTRIRHATAQQPTFNFGAPVLPLRRHPLPALRRAPGRYALGPWCCCYSGCPACGDQVRAPAPARGACNACTSARCGSGFRACCIDRVGVRKPSNAPPRLPPPVPRPRGLRTPARASAQMGRGRRGASKARQASTRNFLLNARATADDGSKLTVSFAGSTFAIKMLGRADRRSVVLPTVARSSVVVPSTMS